MSRIRGVEVEGFNCEMEAIQRLGGWKPPKDGEGTITAARANGKFVCQQAINIHWGCSGGSERKFSLGVIWPPKQITR